MDRSRSERESEKGVELHDANTKPGDLSMGRLK